MLKSYKKVSRWYPSLEPGADGAVLTDAQGDTVFGEDDSPARFPHYISDDEAELVIPPVPDAILRRSHFAGAWSDWMTDRETASYTPKLRYRASTVVEFPSESDEYDRTPPVDTASALLDAVADPPPAQPAPQPHYMRRRIIAVAILVVAILLLAVAGGLALHTLKSSRDTSQSVGTLEEDDRSGPGARTAAYNEMTDTLVIGDHIPAGIPAG
ncbi:hypothetical protein [Nocardia sp. NPDC005978]|uniref:hypothetical protein n=1 Tax=unclassified Nocardia TaxID=2637762 RepID=UPI0033B2C807